MGAKRAADTWQSIANGERLKCLFGPFQGLLGLAGDPNGSPCAQKKPKHLFGQPTWSGNNYGTNVAPTCGPPMPHFQAFWDLGGPIPTIMVEGSTLSRSHLMFGIVCTKSPPPTSPPYPPVPPPTPPYPPPYPPP